MSCWSAPWFGRCSWTGSERSEFSVWGQPTSVGGWNATTASIRTGLSMPIWMLQTSCCGAPRASGAGLWSQAWEGFPYLWASGVSELRLPQRQSAKPQWFAQWRTWRCLQAGALPACCRPQGSLRALHLAVGRRHESAPPPPCQTSTCVSIWHFPNTPDDPLLSRRNLMTKQCVSPTLLFPPISLVFPFFLCLCSLPLATLRLSRYVSA